MLGRERRGGEQDIKREIKKKRAVDKNVEGKDEAVDMETKEEEGLKIRSKKKKKNYK